MGVKVAQELWTGSARPVAGRGGRVQSAVRRAQDPQGFWFVVALDVVGGLILGGAFLWAGRRIRPPS